MNRLCAFALLALVSLSWTSCDRNEPEPEPEIQPGRVLVLNQGGFQQSTSSISRYNPDTKAVLQDVFADQNGSNPGDVLQSGVLVGDQLFLVVNNSGRIIACDPDSLLETGRLEGLTSPRYVLPLGGNLAYVSDLFGGSISKINLQTLDIVASIPLAGWTEGMVLYENVVWVANYSTGKLYLLNPNSDTVEDSLEVGPGASDLGLDAENKLWVLCQGDFQTSAPGSLFRVDPITRQVIQKIGFPAGYSASQLGFTPDRDSLFFLAQGDLAALSITASALPSAPFRAASGSVFYALGVDPVTGEIYVGDAVDFVQRGQVFRLSPGGTAIDTFSSGIIPGFFMFLPE